MYFILIFKVFNFKILIFHFYNLFIIKILLTNPCSSLICESQFSAMDFPSTFFLFYGCSESFLLENKATNTN